MEQMKRTYIMMQMDREMDRVMDRAMNREETHNTCRKFSEKRGKTRETSQTPLCSRRRKIIVGCGA
jgi:hypothetical protein